jgi:cation diffusion facilitator family transporter
MRSTSLKLESGARLALAGVGLNVALCVVKITAGVFGHSYALIADGFESMLDIVSSLLIWAGLKIAARPADDSHPYGHGKAEPVAAIIGSVMILGAALALAVESVQALYAPRAAPHPYTLAVLVVVIVVKEWQARRVKKLAAQTSSIAMESDATHHRGDAITSASAFIGITISLIGGKGYEAADSWAALFACVIIAYNGFQIFWPSLRDLMDTAPPRDFVQHIREAALTVPGVAATEQCRIRKMGLEFYVDLHIKVDGSISVTAGHEIAHNVKDAVRTTVPEVADVLVHVEPAGERVAVAHPA